MVKIAIAGGSGRVAPEIVEVLAATGKHEILILTRREPAVAAAAAEYLPNVTFVKTDYSDKTQLVNIFNGVHTVLSFIGAHVDPSSAMQKLLVEAAVIAGVKRFAPSEWGSSKIDDMPWYAEKGNMRAYLAEMNKEKKVIEYTLFQPGLLLEFLAPLGASKHFDPPELFVDFSNRRALAIEGKDGAYTLTTITDLANVVARAIEYEGEWPVVSGINGGTMTISKLLDIGAKARGVKPFDITTLKEEDVRAGNIKSPWIPKYEDTSLPAEQIDTFAKIVLTGTLLSCADGCWVVSDEWNRLLPDYKFADVEETLLKYWAGQPSDK